MKRWILFLLVNILIISTLSIIAGLLGIEPYLTSYGLNYQSLMVFCLFWGMGGAFISLLLSKTMAKWMMGVKIIDGRGPHQNLVMMVHHLAKKAGLDVMPEVGIYQSPDVNAFATGPSKNRSLVAVSSGLLQHMDQSEVEGVLAHEIGHVANGDMVTMTLIQGIINAFVMFLSRVVAFALSSAMRRDDGERSSSGGMLQFGLIFVFQWIFGLMAMPIVAWFSRQREFRADRSGAKLAGREKMVAALEKLKRAYPITAQIKTEQSMQTLQISSRSDVMKWFATHPPLDERIAALKRGQV